MISTPLYITNKPQEIQLEKQTTMKTLRLFGLTLMAILLSVNFTSCSNEDDPTKDPEKLIGEWILINEKEWGTQDGENYSNEESYDFNNPTEDSMKWIIKEGNGENEFIIEEYFHDGNKWRDDGEFAIRLEGKKIITLDEDHEEEGYNFEITYELNGNKLKVVQKETSENWEYNYEMTFQKK